MDDIARQARQGSVAAIIHTLNEKLADIGVRTRAVFVDGVLQLLCEAAMPEQLERSVLVVKIRKILEEIAPHNIRRVNINSRIVREQQLLWLEEISRDPENQLLWSEEITLTKPNLFKRRLENRKHYKDTWNKKPPLPKTSSRYLKEKNPYWRGIISGVSLSVLLILVGWFLHERLAPKQNAKILTQSSNRTTNTSINSAASPTPIAAPTPDPFAQAVRLAEQASAEGKTVTTSAQWLDLAAKWERASDYMKAVQPDDQRYKTAQDRMKLYRKNSEAAQKQAKRSRS